MTANIEEIRYLLFQLTQKVNQVRNQVEQEGLEIDPYAALAMYDENDVISQELGIILALNHNKERQNHE